MKLPSIRRWQLLPFNRKLRRELALLSAGALGSALLAYWTPLVQREFINLLSQRDGRAWQLLALTAALFGLTRLLGGWINLRSTLWANAITLKLKNRIARQTLFLPYGILKNMGGGYLAGRLSSDTESIQSFLSSGLFPAIVNVGRLTGALCFFIFFNWRIAAAALPFALLYFGIVRLFYRRNRQLSHEILESNAAAVQTTGDLFSRAALIKSMNAEREAAARMSDGFRRQASLKDARVRLQTKFLASGSLVLPVMQGVLLIFGVHLILQGEWDLGTLWALNCYLGLLLTPVRTLCGTLFQLENVDAALDRIGDLSNGPKENAGGSLRPVHLAGKIELRDLSFAYPDQPPLLERAQLMLSPQSHAVITGLSGSGKSTLAALLIGLYRPQSGEILLDDAPLGSYRLSSLRRRIGFVAQETELFRGTLRDNLVTGLPHPHPADEVLTAALTQVGVARPLDEKVLENGGGFSGGEKMRIALARELLHHSDILLLDECTAPLDDDNCRRILDLVETLFADKTILAFSHDARLSARFPLHYRLADGHFIATSEKGGS